MEVLLPKGYKMTITPQPWISVSERLPVSGQQVLACVRLPHWTHEMRTLIETLDYDQGRFLDDDEDPRKYVTHWMPLPEPPV